MDRNISGDESRERIKDKNQFFTAEDKHSDKYKDEYKIEDFSESKEDLEATPINIHTEIDNTYTDVKGNKSNGYLKEGGMISEGSKLNDEEIGKLNFEEELKDHRSNTDRANNGQRGESATPYNNANLDSPNSQSNLKGIKESGKGLTTLNNKNERRLSHNNNNKGDLGWNEQNKNKNRTEDEKHDEEKSLLDPDNMNNLYIKDQPSNNLDDDRDMRRSSTKPERPRESRDQGRGSKASKSDSEEKVKEMSVCQKKSIAFVDSWQWGLFMTVVTIYTLFFDDIRVILIPKAADDAFYTITVI
jgi:hypothetical protein